MDIYIELFGYLGSTLVVVSMLMASVVKLRLINTLGSIISATYAFIIGSFPLALMNVCLIIINVYNLLKLLKTRQQYDLICAGAEESFVTYFLRRYAEDIRSYFPDFDGTQGMDAVYLVCCNGDPAGLLLGKRRADGAVEVALDYTTPTYRDCSVGAYLYGRLKQEGITSLTASVSHSQAHNTYLKKMGFRDCDGKLIKGL
jgi:hypothetical protein